jgi:GR25 family glycosyltransferase involved in LPS biosynthesis
MRIGIGYVVDGLSTTSSRAQTTLHVTEMCESLGHDVVLVLAGTTTGRGFWTDMDVGDWLTISAKDLEADKGSLDLLIDVDGMMPASSRPARTVVLFRHDPAFRILEKVPYLTKSPLYTLQGVSEVWVWDLLTPESSVPLLESLFDLPVRRVPYVWTPIHLGSFGKRVHKAVPCTEATTLHILESNTGTTSNCILPLVGASKCTGSKEVRVFNGELEKERFFRDNIHANIKGLNISYEPRESITNWLDDDILVVTHQRFITCKPVLLDLLWLGIPFVHNCAFLKEVCPDTYYPENDVEALANRIDSFKSPTTEQGRKWIEDTLSVQKGQKGWTAALNTPLTLAPKPPIGATVAVAAATEAPSQQSEDSALRISFSDMWEGFDPQDNFFLDLLRATLGSQKEVVGTAGQPSSLHIYGPFGSAYKAVSAPKVFFSGERVRTEDLQDAGTALNLTHSVMEDDRHIRFPLWLLFLDWFKTGSARRNPNGAPVELATRPLANTKRYLGSMVVSNPTCSERNRAFEALGVGVGQPLAVGVDRQPLAVGQPLWRSGGTYKNNIGGPLSSLYGGGGAGDTAKLAFLQDHTYNLCFENGMADGYVTEKLLHAKLAGCVPLYWGPPEALTDFDASGVVMCDASTIVETVRDLEANPQKRDAIAATPAFSGPQLVQARRLLGKVGTALLRLADPSLVVPKPIVCSFATANFWPSLTLSVQSFEALGKRIGVTFRYIGYVGADVSEEQRGELEAKYPFLEARRLPAESPVAGFPDFFEPGQFGWKLWILKELCSELKGSLVLYTDAGISWTSLPTEMLQKAYKEGVCLLEDWTQINQFWCSKAFCDTLSVTDKELEARQVLGGLVAFRAGSPLACRLLDEAFRIGSQKDCLFGAPIEGTKDDGQAFGHRHDQSILSLLRLRLDVPVLDMRRVVCSTSVRKTYQTGASAYLHRGNPVVHVPVLPGVDDLWVVSLDRRADRWVSWATTYRGLQGVANRFPAIDGRSLVLTPALAALFQRNDFQWKKSVTGCALSHILLWAQLACEHPAVKSYLILEDDQRFARPDWKTVWDQAAALMPADAELLYLGGVLPGNLEVYPTVLDPVNDVWATLKPTTLFSSEPQPVFHFCTYAYVLTRAGAIKLLRALQTGCTTSIDHYLMRQGLRTYVMRDLLATCFQENDPVYKASDFDNFQRVDTFDSDIWNNKECFTGSVLSNTTEDPVRLEKALTDVLNQCPHSIQTRLTLRPSVIMDLIQKDQTLCYRLGSDGDMELGWLKSLCPSLTLVPFTTLQAVRPGSFLLVARPNLDHWTAVAEGLQKAGTPFRILHLSDELVGATAPTNALVHHSGSDSLDLYHHSCCTHVIRNYVRPNLTNKVQVIPLGFATPPVTQPIPSWSSRSLTWSFHGTAWFNREAQLEPLLTVEPHSLHLTPGWKHPSATSPADWQTILLNTKFVPVPRGNHFETFRFYEALEHGAIPLYVRTEGDDEFWAWITQHLTLIELKNWSEALALIELFESNDNKYELLFYQFLLEQWATWKEECRGMFTPSSRSCA